MGRKPKPPILFTTAQAAEQVGCDDSTIRRWARDKRLGIETPGAWLFTPADIAALRLLVRSKPGRPPSAP